MPFRTPEKTRPSSLLSSASNGSPSIRHSPKPQAGSPVKRTASLFSALVAAANNASPKKASGGGVLTSAPSAVGGTASHLSKEKARFAKQLLSLAGGNSTTRHGFLNSGASSASRFSASATAGITGGSSFFSSPILKENNNTINTSPSTTSSSNSSEKSSLLRSLTDTPKSTLGKRSSVTAGLVPTSTSISTPMSTSTPGTKTPLTQSVKTPRPAPQSTARSAAKATSPQRPHAHVYGRVLSVGSGLGAAKSMAQQAASCLTRTISSNGLKTKLEVVTNDYQTGGSSPKKGRKVFIQADRFIPSRTMNSMASAQVQLEIAQRTCGSSSSSSSSNSASSTASTSSFRRHPSAPVIPLPSQAPAPPLSEATLAYNQQIAEACGISLDRRMLSFNSEAPTLSNLETTTVRKMYSRHPSFTRSNSNLLLKKRTILSSPEKVLDAPGLMDDYYLNLLDWSCSNMVAIGLDKSVFIWDAETGHAESLVTLPGNTDGIASVSWAYDGLFLAIGTFDGDTQIWDIETKSKVRSMTGHLARVGVLSWDKHILSSGCRDGSIWNHDVRIQNHKVAELLSHTNEVCGLKWRSDGQQLASGGNDNLVNIWDPRSTVPKFTKTNHTAAVKALAWCPWQNNLLASGGGTYDKQIHFWNTHTGARTQSLNTGSQVTSIVWSTEYKEFVSSHGFPDNNLSLYSFPSLSKVIDIKAHDSRVLHTAISPDGQTVATVASDENLKFWKLFERQQKKKGKSRPGSTTTATCGSGSGGLGYDEDDYDDSGKGATYKGGKTLSSMTRLR
ncbi:ubiquitin-protein transferase activating protein [Mortierella sp. GBA30]|nr:ubiquitin-protein transferase activating protein [Mortierella sp. GBA30]